MKNPLNFSNNETTIEKSFMLNGPTGMLEVKTAEPKTQTFPITVINCHPHPLHGGMMENKVVTTIFRTFRQMGARVLRFNYRGVGKSEGEYGHGIGETDDLLAVIQWVKQVRPLDQIWLTGFSFGAYVVMRAASDKALDIKQLLTIAPAVDRVDFEGLAVPECPWLVIQGDADEVVSPQAVFHWVDTLPSPPTLIKVNDAGHFFHGRLLDLRKILEDHYQNLMDKITLI